MWLSFVVFISFVVIHVNIYINIYTYINSNGASLKFFWQKRRTHMMFALFGRMYGLGVKSREFIHINDPLSR